MQRKVVRWLDISMKTVKLLKRLSQQDVFFFPDFGFSISKNEHESYIA